MAEPRRGGLGLQKFGPPHWHVLRASRGDYGTPLIGSDCFVGISYNFNSFEVGLASLQASHSLVEAYG